MDDNWAFHVPLKAVTLCQVWMSPQGNAQAMGSKAKRKTHIAPSQRTKKNGWSDLSDPSDLEPQSLISSELMRWNRWTHLSTFCYSIVTCIHAFHRLRLEPKRIPLLTVMSLLLQYCHLVLLHPIKKKKEKTIIVPLLAISHYTSSLSVHPGPSLLYHHQALADTRSLSPLVNPDFSNFPI